MPAIAIQDPAGSLLAFLLISGEDAVLKTSGTSDCIFMGVPSPAVPIDSPSCLFFQDRKLVERKATIQHSPDELVLSIASENWSFTARLNADGAGKWKANDGSNKDFLGLCLISKKKAG